MKKKDFISIRNIENDELLQLIDHGLEIKKNPAKYSAVMKGKSLALVFEKPSLRTRVTFDVGFYQLGGHPVYLSPAEISIGKRESVADVARNLERMVQGVMIRTFGHEIVEQMAEIASIPIINGLTDYSHPCQALADYLTMKEIKGDLRKIKVAFIGDGNNVVRSLMFGAARLGVHLAIATPKGYELDEKAIQWARETGDATGCRLEIGHDPVAAAVEADVVYSDVWASMGQETEAEERKNIFGAYQVNEQLFSRAKSDAIFMHCLPAHRGEEITADVLEGSQSVVWDQAENKMHMHKAILDVLLSGR